MDPVLVRRGVTAIVRIAEVGLYYIGCVLTIFAITDDDGQFVVVFGILALLLGFGLRVAREKLLAS